MNKATNLYRVSDITTGRILGTFESVSERGAKTKASRVNNLPYRWLGATQVETDFPAEPAIVEDASDVSVLILTGERYAFDYADADGMDETEAPAIPSEFWNETTREIEAMTEAGTLHTWAETLMSERTEAQDNPPRDITVGQAMGDAPLTIANVWPIKDVSRETFILGGVEYDAVSYYRSHNQDQIEYEARTARPLKWGAFDDVDF